MMRVHLLALLAPGLIFKELSCTTACTACCTADCTGGSGGGTAGHGHLGAGLAAALGRGNKHKYAVSQVAVQQKIRTPFWKKRTGFEKILALEVKNPYVCAFPHLFLLPSPPVLHIYAADCINIQSRLRNTAVSSVVGGAFGCVYMQDGTWRKAFLYVSCLRFLPAPLRASGASCGAGSGAR